MKKINLKGLSKTLSENELENIKGGYGNAGTCGTPDGKCPGDSCTKSDGKSGECMVTLYGHCVCGTPLT